MSKYIKKTSILPLTQIGIQYETTNKIKTNQSHMYIKLEPFDQQIKLMEEGKLQHNIINIKPK